MRVERIGAIRIERRAVDEEIAQRGRLVRRLGELAIAPGIAVRGGRIEDRVVPGLRGGEILLGLGVPFAITTGLSSATQINAEPKPSS